MMGEGHGGSPKVPDRQEHAVLSRVAAVALAHPIQDLNEGGVDMKWPGRRVMNSAAHIECLP